MQWKGSAPLFTLIAVDDEMMIKRTIRKLLESSERFRWIGEAEDGEEALVLIERLRPDVVVTDIRMPGLNGLELIERLKLSDPQPEFVILSGYNDFPFIQEAIRQGAADYLLKPLKPDEFYSTLGRVDDRLREKRMRESAQEGLRAQWLPLCRDAGMRIADSAWQLQEEEWMQAIEQLRLQLQESWPADYDRHSTRMWQDLLYIVSAELQRRGGIELPMPGFSDPEQPGRTFAAAKEAIREGTNRIRLSRNWRNYRQVQSAVDEVNARFSDPSLTMQSLADKLSMSPAHFSRSFKAETGTTFVQLVTQLRLERARELLADPESTMTEAARGSGFADYPHFAKAFKRRFGVSPTEYRKRLGIQ